MTGTHGNRICWCQDWRIRWGSYCSRVWAVIRFVLVPSSCGNYSGWRKMWSMNQAVRCKWVSWHLGVAWASTAEPDKMPSPRYVVWLSYSSNYPVCDEAESCTPNMQARSVVQSDQWFEFVGPTCLSSNLTKPFYWAHYMLLIPLDFSFVFNYDVGVLSLVV